MEICSNTSLMECFYSGKKTVFSFRVFSFKSKNICRMSGLVVIFILDL